MIKLKPEEFKNLLDTDEITFSFAISGGVLEVSPSITIMLDERMTNAEIKHSGYEIIRYSGGDVAFHETFEEYGEAFEYISKYVRISDTVNIDKMNGFETQEEFYADRRFTNATMRELLEKYKDCNVFSLTCYTREKISRAKADEIIARERISAEREAAKLYESEDTSGLPPLETLIKEVREECAEFTAQNRRKFPEKRYGKYIASFISDYVADEKTKYYGPDFLWHFYSEFGREYDNIAYINDRVSCGENDADEFAESGCEFLRDKILRVDTAFENHCTKTSELLKTYYFPLDDETREWLSAKENDYDFDIESLCDLAFYCGGKLRFSSCTHEQFHNDIKQ